MVESQCLGSGKEVVGTLGAAQGSKLWLGNQEAFSGDFHVLSYGIPGNLIGRKPENGGNAVEPMHDVAPCQTKTDVHGVAFVDVTGTLTSAYFGTCGQPTDAISSGLCALSECIGGQHPNAAVCTDGVSPTLTSAMGVGGGHIPIVGVMKVRRLTPTECERLQGFPDGYTDIKPNGKPTPDGPRYKALGNSWAVPNVRWIGKRIDDAIKNK